MTASKQSYLKIINYVKSHPNTFFTLLFGFLVVMSIWMMFDLNDQYQTSEKYGGDYIRYGWIEEKTSCHRLAIQILLKDGGLFTPSTHIPALLEWEEKMNCADPDSKYWRNADYSYDVTFGTNLQGKEIGFIEFDEWVKLESDKHND